MPKPPGFIVDAILQEDGTLKICELGNLESSGLKGLEALEKGRGRKARNYRGSHESKGSDTSHIPWEYFEVITKSYGSSILWLEGLDQLIHPVSYSLQAYNTHNFLKGLAAIAQLEQSLETTEHPINLSSLLQFFQQKNPELAKTLLKLSSQNKLPSNLYINTLPTELARMCKNKDELCINLKNNPCLPVSLTEKLNSEDLMGNVREFVRDNPEITKWVLKPVNMACGSGVTILSREDLLDHDIGSAEIDSGDTFWSKHITTNPSSQYFNTKFVLQAFANAKTISITSPDTSSSSEETETVSTKTYKPTIRLIYLQNPDRTYSFSDAYYKLPTQSLEESKSEDETHISRISSRNKDASGAVSAEIPKDTLIHIRDQFERLTLPKIRELCNTDDIDISQFEELKSTRLSADEIVKNIYSLVKSTFNSSSDNLEYTKTAYIAAMFSGVKLQDIKHFTHKEFYKDYIQKRLNGENYDLALSNTIKEDTVRKLRKEKADHIQQYCRDYKETDSSRLSKKHRKLFDIFKPYCAFEICNTVKQFSTCIDLYKFKPNLSKYNDSLEQWKKALKKDLMLPEEYKIELHSNGPGIFRISLDMSLSQLAIESGEKKPSAGAAASALAFAASRENTPAFRTKTLEH